MNFLNQLNKKQWIYLMFFLITSTALFFNEHLFYENENSLKQKLKNNFEKKEQKANDILKQISGNPELIFEKENFFTKLSEEDGIEIFIFKKDTPLVWTSAIVHPQDVLDAISRNENYLETPSVKAVIVKLENKNENIALIKLIEAYSIENKYIKNKNYLLPNFDGKIELTKYNSEQNGIFYQSKEPAFSFQIIYNTDTARTNKTVVLIIFIIALISWLLFINETRKAFVEKEFLVWVVSLLLSIFLWFLFFSSKSNILFQTKIFDPTLFAVFTWLSSLGEFLTISFLGIFFAVTFPQNQVNKSKWGRISALLYYIVIYSFSVFSTKWLVENSSLNFDFNNISQIDIYSIIAIINVCLLFFSAIKLFEICFLNNNSEAKISFLIFCFLSAILFWFNEVPLFFILVFSFLLPVILLLTISKTNTINVFSLFIIALSLFVFLDYTINQKESFSKNFLAQKIALDNDPLAELLFQEMKKDLERDKELENYINEEDGVNKSLLQLYLKDKYFNGYWDKYIFQVTPCFNNDSIIVQPANKTYLCKEFFNAKIAAIGRAINQEEDLFILDNETGVGSYLAIVEKKYKSKEQQKNLTLYIELNAKIIPEGSGYPELLLDSRYSKVSNNNNRYSYAKYKNKNLVLSAGNYKYPLQLPDWAEINQLSNELIQNDSKHYILKPNEELTIIVSNADFGIFGKLTGITYLFGILSFIFFLYNLYHLGIKKSLKRWKNFRTRIQVLVAGTIAFATIIFGIATVYYQLRQYDQQNTKIIREKLRSILTEIEQKIGDKDQLNGTDEELLTYYLIKFSNVFFSDLNFYNTDGELLASSRKNIFEMGLSSTKMNAFAFNQLNRLQNEQFIHREKIGLLSFFSAYAIIKNDEGETLGILNIPYFARQDEMEKEISFFIGALINVYVVLFLLSIFIAIVISRLIAEPLQLISSRLGDIALGKPNKPIEWSSEDEIGRLINEYNRMIQQLEESAEKLARSERESAWREMARQVAHEIKNPLTPMKLSVQHLQKTWKESPEEFEQRLKKFTQNLVEQIDTLSNIANEFSDFAKMPKPNTQPLDIFEIAQQSIEFFKPTTKSHILLHKKTEKTMVLADKDQMIRVFNNLLKNAIQAIEIEEDGLIEVQISKENEMIQIAVRDNGNGIDDELQEKIFSPNFTTKTSGMGLGLAMVKSIINSHGGTIWFESEIQKGTTFFFTLPIVENVA
jgi:signal transduction histidine kinase